MTEIQYRQVHVVEMEILEHRDTETFETIVRYHNPPILEKGLNEYIDEAISDGPLFNSHTMLYDTDHGVDP